MYKKWKKRIGGREIRTVKGVGKTKGNKRGREEIQKKNKNRKR